MKKIEVTAQHEDTCDGQFLTDHHNRDGELFLGIGLYGQSADDAAYELLEELFSADWGREDLESIPDDQFLAAFREAAEDVDFRPFDDDGNPVDPPGEAADDETRAAWD